MKKSVGIILSLLLLVCALTPALAFAEDASAASDIIYFLNPTAIAAVNDKLYVADNIEEGKSVILCFDVSGSKPVYCFTEETDGNISNLSAKGNGLYAIFSDKVEEYDVADNGSLQEKQTFNVKNAIDFVYGVIDRDDTMGEYYATNSQFFAKDPRVDDITNVDYFLPVGFSSTSEVSGMAAIDRYIYCLFRLDGNVVCQRIDGQLARPASSNDPLNKNTSLLNPVDSPKGLFVYGQQVGVFSETSVWFVEIGESNSTVNPLIDAESYGSDKGAINDVVANGEDIYILNEQHKIEIYKKNPVGGNYESVATIGTETLPRAVPAISELNSYTLVKCVGYPSNIVFKTSDEKTSIENLMDNADEYIVLGWDNEDPNFYYVLVGDKFGWVKKSDGADSLETDPNLKVIDTTMSQGNVEYKTKFISLDAVYIAPLPHTTFLTEEYRIVYNQSAQNLTEVTALQRFTDNGGTLWYYVRYGGNKTGFVKEENIGKFFLNRVNDGEGVDGESKANGKLFGYVQLYDNNDPATMDEDHHVTNNVGEEIKHLSSGTRVTVVKKYDNGTALVQVVYGDGTTAMGYCYISQLIPVGALTTTAVFGLTATGIAVVLAIILTAVFLHRRKNKKARTDAEQQE